MMKNFIKKGLIIFFVFVFIDLNIYADTLNNVFNIEVKDSNVGYNFLIYKENEITINEKVGIVCVHYKLNKDTSYKVMVEKNGKKIFYDHKKDMESYPLQMGNGKYFIRLYEKKLNEEKTYKVILEKKTNFLNIDEKLIYLQNTTYNYFSGKMEYIKYFDNLVKDIDSDLEKTKIISKEISKILKYDYDLVDKLNNKKITQYKPNLKTVFFEKKGICFGYSSLLSANLRYQNIPCKLVMGDFLHNGEKIYHAWNEVLINNEWIIIDATNSRFIFDKNDPLNNNYIKRKEY